jgi:type I restriction enzyme S subunit
MKSKWKTKRLGDISTINYGYTAKASFNKADSLFLRITDIQDNFVDWKTVPYCSISEIDYEKYKLIDNDIVFARTGATTGKSYLIKKPPKSVAASYLIRLRLTDCDILPEFIAKYFQTPTYWNDISLGIVGSAQGGFNASKLSDLIIPVPPIEEQKRIVEILDKAFEGIAQAEANTRRNLANTRQFLANVRNNILNKNSNNWHPTTLKKEINLLSGFAFKSQFYTQSEDDISLLRGDNIMQGYLRWDNTQKWKKSEFDTFSKFKLKENDLVLAMDRPWVSAGLKYAEITSNDLPCLLVQRVARLRCCENLNNRFLFHLIGDRKFIKHILGKQTGIGVPHISGKQIESFEFLKPPLEKQKNIASLLDRIYSKTQKLETIYQRKLEAIAELKQSILEKAFTGQLSQ